ncbi:hypothetical protein [Pseudarthrobacter sp. Y6]|uniref:hypothetical protein n=1 Tax=Pseudarthrobacter sp. Y6 TaxID=3418422 RepID=UPI003CEBB1F0
MFSLRHESDRQLAARIAASLDRVGHRVSSLVPPGYQRYVRILNPVEIEIGSVVRWSDIVENGGRETSPWMQWDELAAHSDAVPGNNAQPEMGNPHPTVAEALIRVLDVDSRRYNFASWEGYSGEDGESAIEFSPMGREMVLYSGRMIDEEGTSVIPITASGRVPMYWWPDDLHWCIGQDIYARSLIIGCDLATAGKILADPDLDAYLIRETDAVPPEDF